MENVYVRCNYCDSDDYELLFPAGKAQIHQVVKCKKCGLIYANPQSTHTIEGKVSADEGKIYDKEQLEKDLIEFIPDKNQYLKKQYIQQKDYLKVLDYIDSREKGTLMDIGSYTGVFLNSAREKGWKVLGIEPMPLPRIYSQREFGINVISEPFEQAVIPDNSIDVVVAFHVIEHVYSPKDFISKAHNALKKNGLMILETPTYDSLTFKLLKHRERSVRCNGHIYFFTRESLGKMVETAGFRIIHHPKVGRTLSLDRLFHNVGIITGMKPFFKKVATFLRLEKFTIYLNMRDMQRIYCEKI